VSVSPASSSNVTGSSNVAGLAAEQDYVTMLYRRLDERRRYTAQQALQWGLGNAVGPIARLDEEVAKWT